jgi:hypothetical protein
VEKGKSGEYHIEGKSRIYCVKTRVLSELIIRVKHVRECCEDLLIYILLQKKHVRKAKIKALLMILPF